MTKRIGSFHHHGHPTVLAFQGDIVILSRKDTRQLNKDLIGTLRKPSGEGVSAKLYKHADLLAASQKPEMRLIIDRAILEHRVAHISPDKVLHMHASQTKVLANAGIERLVFKNLNSSLQLQPKKSAGEPNADNVEGIKVEEIDENQYEEYFAELMEFMAQDGSKRSEEESAATAKQVQLTSGKLESDTPDIPRQLLKAQPKTKKGESIERGKEEETAESARGKKRKLWEADQEKTKIFNERERRAIEKDERQKEVRKDSTI